MIDFGQPAFWVSVGFLLFIALLVRLRAWPYLANALDARVQRIRQLLEEAGKERKAAQSLLAEAQKKLRDAESQAGAIYRRAEENALILQKKAEEEIAARLARRVKTMEQRIDQAEREITDETRQIAARIAIAASRDVVAQSLSKAEQNKKITEAIVHIQKIQAI